MLDKIYARSAILIFWLLSFLPLSCLHILGTFSGIVMWIFPGRYKRRARENFQQAFQNRGAFVDCLVLIEMMKMYLELPYLWAPRNFQRLNKLVSSGDWGPIDRALALGKGALFVSAHVGCFEMLLPYITQRYSGVGIFKIPRKNWIKLFLSRFRKYPNLQMVPANSRGVKELIGTLQKGRPIGILADHIPPEGGGVYAPFFGRPAYTMNLIKRLQLIRESPIFIVGVERLNRSKGYRFHAIALGELLSDDHQLAATQINKALEELISIMPNQYLWGYNRYKQPRPGPKS